MNNSDNNNNAGKSHKTDKKTVCNVKRTVCYALKQYALYQASLNLNESGSQYSSLLADFIANVLENENGDENGGTIGMDGIGCTGTGTGSNIFSNILQNNCFQLVKTCKAITTTSTLIFGNDLKTLITCYQHGNSYAIWKKTIWSKTMVQQGLDQSREWISKEGRRYDRTTSCKAELKRETTNSYKTSNNTKKTSTKPPTTRNGKGSISKTTKSTKGVQNEK